MRSLLNKLLPGLTSIFLGFLIVSQFRAHDQATRSVTQGGSNQALYVGELTDGNANLLKQQQTLQEQLSRYENNNPAAKLKALQADEEALAIVDGQLKVSGPGIIVSVSGPNINPVDLQDMLNELRNAGAEVIALNDRRLVASSAIAGEVGNVTIDGVKLPNPYIFKAIGDGETLKTALLRKGGFVAILQQNNPHSVELNIANSLVIAPLPQSSPWKFAKPN